MLHKVENYHRALERLREALAEYAQHPASTVIRDGVIQRFEFTFELAWKSLRDYLEDQGFAPDIVSPKETLRRAFSCAYIHDDGLWLDMLNSRNLTSHVYSDDQAAHVVADIRERYMPALEELAGFYQRAE